MSLSTLPPERHFGYVCRKCKVSDFLGRRYACWLCIDYQLCGTCYDSGKLPVSREHNYFHPLEVYYSRAEYELYFAGEPYVDSNIPQSYKCALCDACGFTCLQLYKHLSDMHRDHADFSEYFSILYTRYTADGTSPPLVGTISSSSAAYLRNMRPMLQVTHRTPEEQANIRNAFRLAQARRASLLEQQAYNVLEELRENRSKTRSLTAALRAENREQQQQQEEQDSQEQEQQERQRAKNNRPNEGVLEPRSVRTPKSIRGRGFLPGIRLCPVLAKSGDATQRRSLAEDAWDGYWGSSPNISGDQRVDRIMTSFADTVRGNIVERASPDKKVLEKDKNKYLCIQFKQIKKLPVGIQQLHPTPAELSRNGFIEALLCSMLADEQLTDIPLELADVGMLPKLLDASNKPKMELNQIDAGCGNRFSAGIMDRFYKGLDNYHKWLGDFTAKKLEYKSKNCNDDTIIPAIPTIIMQSTDVPINVIDYDLDADTDEREGEDEDAESSKVSVEQDCKLSQVGSEGDAEEENPDAEGAGEYMDEIEELDDGDDVEDEEDEDDGDFDNSGSETSDSTIAMLVNAIDQVYGY